MTRAAPSRLQFPAEATDPRFRLFFDYWASKAPPDRLPGRQHIDPLEMKAFLPYLRLLDIVRDGNAYRFRYRLIGSHVMDLHGPTEIGTFVDQYALPVHYDSFFYPNMMAIMETRQPRFSIRHESIRPENFRGYHVLNAPLAADGVTVDMIIGFHLGVRLDGTIMES
jgi:hypothetical protein